MNLGHHLKKQVLWQRRHLRPVLDIRSKLNLNRRICLSLAVKHTVCVNILVKMIFLSCEFHIQVCRCCKEALICRSRRDGTGIHKRNRRNLSVLKLRALTIREISCRMADGQPIVCRSIPRPKARPAERSLHDCSCLHQICNRPVLH